MTYFANFLFLTYYQVLDFASECPYSLYTLLAKSMNSRANKFANISEKVLLNISESIVLLSSSVSLVDG